MPPSPISEVTSLWPRRIPGLRDIVEKGQVYGNWGGPGPAGCIQEGPRSAHPRQLPVAYPRAGALAVPLPLLPRRLMPHRQPPERVRPMAPHQTPFWEAKSKLEQTVPKRRDPAPESLTVYRSYEIATIGPRTVAAATVIGSMLEDRTSLTHPSSPFWGVSYRRCPCEAF